MKKNKPDLDNKNSSDFDIDLFIKVMDNKKIEKINELINDDDNNNNIGIVFKIFKNNLLTNDRLNFIFKNCESYLHISLNIIKALIIRLISNITPCN